MTSQKTFPKWLSCMPLWNVFMWSLPFLKSDIVWNLLSLREWTSCSSCVGSACVRVIVAGKWMWWKPQHDSCNGCSSCFSLVKLLPRSKSRNCLPYNLLTTLVALKWMEASNLSQNQNKKQGDSSSLLYNVMSCSGNAQEDWIKILGTT